MSRPESRKASRKEALRRGGDEWRFMTEMTPPPAPAPRPSTGTATTSVIGDTPPRRILSSSSSARQSSSMAEVVVGGPSPPKQLQPEDLVQMLRTPSLTGVSSTGSSSLPVALKTSPPAVPSPPRRQTMRASTILGGPRQPTRPLSRQPRCVPPSTSDGTSKQFQDSLRGRALPMERLSRDDIVTPVIDPFVSPFSTTGPQIEIEESTAEVEEEGLSAKKSVRFASSQRKVKPHPPSLDMELLRNNGTNGSNVDLRSLVESKAKARTKFLAASPGGRLVVPHSPRHVLETPNAVDSISARRRRSQTSREFAAVTDAQLVDTEHPFGHFASLVDDIQREFGYCEPDELQQLERLVSDLKNTDLCRRYAQFHPLLLSTDNVVKPMPTGMITPSWQLEVLRMKERLDAIRRAPNPVMHEQQLLEPMVMPDGETILELRAPTSPLAIGDATRSGKKGAAGMPAIEGGTSGSPRVVAASAPFGVLRRRTTLRRVVDTDSEDMEEDHDVVSTRSWELSEGESDHPQQEPTVSPGVLSISESLGASVGQLVLPQVLRDQPTPPAPPPKVRRSENPFHEKYLHLDRIDMAERQARLQAVTDNSVAHLKALGLLK